MLLIGLVRVLKPGYLDCMANRQLRFLVGSAILACGPDILARRPALLARGPATLDPGLNAIAVQSSAYSVQVQNSFGHDSTSARHNCT